MNIQTIIRNIKAISRRELLVIFTIVVAICVISSILLRGDSFTVLQLAVPASNESVEIIDDTLYAYNGANFYKQSINKLGAEPTILGGGVKLPIVTQAVWASDNGVLLNFDQSTISTEVSDVALALGLSYTQERESTWYFDFKENKLLYVGPFQIVDGLGYYDDSKKIIHVAQNSDGLTQLHSYDIANKVTNSVLLSKNYDMVSSISPCADSAKDICVTGRQTDSPKKSGIYRIASSGDIKPLYEAQGEVYSTPGSPWILTLESSDDSSEVTDGSIAQYKRAVARNVITKEIFTVNKSLGPGNFLYTFYDEGKVAVIGAGGSKYVRTGTLSGLLRTSESTLKYSTGSDFTSSPIIKFRPLENHILFSSTDGMKNIFTKKSNGIKATERLSRTTVEKKLKQCANGSDVEWLENSQTFTTFIPESDDYKRSIKNVTECITTQKINQGYLFAFTLVDPETGRPTSY